MSEMAKIFPPCATKCSRQNLATQRVSFWVRAMTCWAVPWRIDKGPIREPFCPATKVRPTQRKVYFWFLHNFCEWATLQLLCFYCPECIKFQVLALFFQNFPGESCLWTPPPPRRVWPSPKQILVHLKIARIRPSNFLDAAMEITTCDVCLG